MTAWKQFANQLPKPKFDKGGISDYYLDEAYGKPVYASEYEFIVSARQMQLYAERLGDELKKHLVVFEGTVRDSGLFQQVESTFTEQPKPDDPLKNNPLKHQRGPRDKRRRDPHAFRSRDARTTRRRSR